MHPKISIITINFNNKSGLERTFESVFSQTFKEFEYIIIDGGSTDGSKELIEKHSEKITYWVSEPDKGIYNAMNKGIKAVNGDYLLFLNSGDEIYEISTLEKCAPILNSAEIISGNLKIVDLDKEKIGETPQSLSFKLFYENTLWHPCTFIKNDAFEKVGLYDENLKIVADWKWFLMAVCHYNLTYKSIDDVISIFYLDGISEDSNSRPIIKEERRKVLENSFPFLLFEYENRIAAEIKVEGYESSRIISLLKKIGFLKGLR